MGVTVRVVGWPTALEGRNNDGNAVVVAKPACEWMTEVGVASVDVTLETV